MMNATHGPSGALAGLIVARAAIAAGMSPSPELAIWCAAGAAAGGMLPDADHHASSTAQVWGPITSVPAGWFGALVGGHRAGSHDLSRGAPLLFAAVFAVGLAAPRVVEFAVSPGMVGDWARLGARVTGMAVVALIAGLCFVALAAVIPGRWEGSGVVNLLASASVAFWVTHWYPAGLPVVVVAAAAVGVVVGATVAIVQDGCTPSGIPWFGGRVWFLPRPFRVTTGSGFERHWIRWPVLVCLVWQAFELGADLGAFGHPFAL